jgi:hypothetical protein
MQINLDLAPYRGSVHFGNWGWSVLVDRILDYSHRDYALTDLIVRMAENYYKHIPVEAIVLDREQGGKVLKEDFLRKVEAKVGMTRDNPSLIRALMKVPYALGCVNLWHKQHSVGSGLHKPMHRLIDCRKVNMKHLEWCGIKGFGFHQADGDLWIDLEERIIHWECYEKLYPLHRDLISEVTKHIDIHFFSDTNGGVIVTPEATKSYGNGKEVLYSKMSTVGYNHRWGVNGIVAFKEPEMEYKQVFKRKTLQGEDCPKCGQDSVYKTMNEWTCGASCGFEIPFVIQGKIISDSYAVQLAAA